MPVRSSDRGQLALACLLLAGAAAAAILLFAPNDQQASPESGSEPADPGEPRAAVAKADGCGIYVHSAGSSEATGSSAGPLDSVQDALDASGPNATICLLAGGVIDADEEVRISSPGVTLTSGPGGRAELKGRIWVDMNADGTTIADLIIDGRNDRLLALTINADDVTLRDNEITNRHTTICVIVGSPDPEYGRAQDTLIEGNSIHDCGQLPATNTEHGIYVSAADRTIIRENEILSNADRGIQLFPDAQDSVISGNVIDGNGQGLIFGGDEIAASSNNVVRGNTISNSKIRFNVESNWAGPVGDGNVVTGNCIGGGVRDDGDGGIMSPPVGFVVRDPRGSPQTDPPCVPPKP